MDQPSDNSVSVVMPCYNGMPYLTEALDSARAQTHQPLEIIVVEDGSTDDSAATVRRYASEHPEANIKLIEQANAGEPAARNAGIQAATGRWVAALDTDDWWDPRKLALQLEAAAAVSDCVLVHTGVVHHFADGRSEKKDLAAAARRTGWCLNALLEVASIGHPSIMVRRDALETIGGYDSSFKQACDIDLYFRLCAVGTFAFVPEHLLHYRIHPGQMSVDQVQQVSYHHQAIDNFFAAHPDIADRIGRDRIAAAKARLVAAKLESLYWRRRLDQFRRLLDYAREHELTDEEIRNWQSRARVPDWLIHLKDKLTRGSS